jgi:osmotically-inducible protein OsmY
MSRRRVAALLAPLLLAACAHGGGTPTATATAAANADAAAGIGPGDDLAAAVAGRLRAEDAAAFRAVSVKSMGGTVLLTGAVTKPVLRRRAEAAAAAVAGVATVHDDILLAEDSAFAQFMPDAAHERAIAARLAADPGAAGIGVRVVDGVATLMGTAPSAAELERIKTLLLDDPDLKWVDAGAVAVR